MLQEFLWENTQVYREIKELGEEQGEARGIELGRKEGIEEGRKEGIEEGSAKEARWLIETIAQARFPDLFVSLKNQIEQLDDLKKLREISLLVSTAQSAEEVKRALPELQ